MSKKHLFVCPSCHSFFSSSGSVTDRHCSECSAPLVCTDVDYEAYSALSQEQKMQFRKEYLSRHYPAGPTYKASAKPLPGSSWVSLLRFVGWSVFAVFCFLGLYASFSSSFIVGVFILLVGFLSVSGIMVLCVIADDTRFIRNQLSRFIHEQK